MTIWSSSVLVPIILAAFIAQGSPVPAKTKQSGPPVDKPVVEVNIQESNIHLALSKLANQYKLPIGLEVATDDDLLKIEFTKAVVSSHELSSLLEANGLNVEYEIFSKHDIRALGRHFSVNVSDVTVKSLLNQVIKRSETKYWLLNRYGENRQYLLLKL